MKNLMVYRLSQPVEITEEMCAPLEYQPCNSFDCARTGFIRHAVTVDKEPTFMQTVEGFTLLKVKSERRVVPPDALRAETDKRVEKWETDNGHEPGTCPRKIRSELKDDAWQALLPRAFSTFETFYVVISKCGLVLISAGSKSKADRCSLLIRKAAGTFPISPLQFEAAQGDLAFIMTSWLKDKTTEFHRSNFAYCTDAKLVNLEMATHVIKDGELDGELVQGMVNDGWRCEVLELSWKRYVFFKVTRSFEIKGIRITGWDEEPEPQDETEVLPTDVFSVVFTLYPMIRELIAVFGGEVKPELPKLPPLPEFN